MTPIKRKNGTKTGQMCKENGFFGYAFKLTCPMPMIGAKYGGVTFSADVCKGFAEWRIFPKSVGWTADDSAESSKKLKEIPF